jgi:predicted transcriptional regulator
MSIVSFRVDEELKKKMERNRSVNWSEVVRRAISERIELEERLESERSVDFSLISDAVKGIAQLRRKTSGRWSGAEEIRKWRDLRK